MSSKGPVRRPLKLHLCRHRRRSRGALTYSWAHAAPLPSQNTDSCSGNVRFVKRVQHNQSDVHACKSVLSFQFSVPELGKIKAPFYPPPDIIWGINWCLRQFIRLVDVAFISRRGGRGQTLRRGADERRSNASKQIDGTIDRSISPSTCLQSFAIRSCGRSTSTTA